MSTPSRPYLGPGGDATHAAIMNALTPAVLDHGATLADHEARITALESAHGPADTDADEAAAGEMS